MGSNQHPNNNNNSLPYLATTPFLSSSIHYVDLNNVFPRVTAGLVACYATLAGSTLAQQRLFRITTATIRPWPSIMGCLSASVAAMAAHQAALVVQAHHLQEQQNLAHWLMWQRQSSNHDNLKNTLNKVPQMTAQFAKQMVKSVQVTPNDRGDVLKLNKFWSENVPLPVALPNLQFPLYTLRIAGLGLLAFWVLGGRGWRIAPSAYTGIGSFAKRHASLPAGENYATAAQRKLLQRHGRIYGCHTCGTRKFLSQNSLFVGDHQPPKSVMARRNWFLRNHWSSYRFYPQCTDCSSHQGKLLSSSASASFSKLFFFPPRRRIQSSTQTSLFHGLRPRFYHGAGAVVAWAAVDDDDDNATISLTDEEETIASLDNQARQRYRAWDKAIRKHVQNVNRQIRQHLWR